MVFLSKTEEGGSVGETAAPRHGPEAPRGPAHLPPLSGGDGAGCSLWVALCPCRPPLLRGSELSFHLPRKSHGNFPKKKRTYSHHFAYKFKDFCGFGFEAPLYKSN